jgi:hypothetical protein
MKTEESTDRLPYFGTTRGQIVFRYGHQQLERSGNKEETVVYWRCRYIRYAPADIPRQTEEVARELCLAAIRAEAKEQIEDIAGYPQWVQSNVANGLYPTAVADAMRAHIASVIAESNRCEDIVASAVSIDDALAVIPTWPEV